MQLQKIREEIKKAERKVECWQAKPWTAVKLEVKVDGHDIIGYGFSKYNPDDAACPDTPYDEEKGVTIALGRAEYMAANTVGLIRVLTQSQPLNSVLGEIGKAATGFTAALSDLIHDAVALPPDIK